MCPQLQLAEPKMSGKTADPGGGAGCVWCKTPYLVTQFGEDVWRKLFSKNILFLAFPLFILGQLPVNEV